MKKLTALLLVLVCVFSAAGCAETADGNAFEVDHATREGLLDFLESSALGGVGEVLISVDGDVGQDTVGDVSGSVSSAVSGAEIVSYSFLDDTLIEVGRTPVEPSGKWGPVTVLYGPKALILMDGEKVLGYWLTAQVFAMAALPSASSYEDFVVSTRDSGLIALALIHSQKYQEAANLLAAMRDTHIQFGGLPGQADVFGQSQAETIDPGATAWAGYAAAVLARLTDNAMLWEEAQSYGRYLRDAQVPEDSDSRLAGWLLYSELVDRYPEFGYLPERWQPESKEQYDPIIGTWMLMAEAGDLAAYVDFSYLPESQAEKWIHFNLLAALDQYPQDLDIIISDVPGGKAVSEGEGISLEATVWMVLTLTGKIRQ